MPKSITKEDAQQIAVDYLKKKKNTDKIDIAVIDQNREDWVVRGTCPIDMEGHPWAEKFEVIVDVKGKIKNTHASLL